MSLIKLAEKFTEIKNEMMAECEAAIQTEFIKIFAQYPELTVIKWSQI